MKFKLLRYNNSAIEFDMSKIISITANGNLIYVKLSDTVTYTGYCIAPL